MEATRAPSFRVTEVAPRTPTDAQINLQIAQMQLQQRELMEQITNLQKTIQAMQISHRSRDRYRSRSRTRSASQGRNGICWYHSTFGQAAKKCLPPCNA